VNTLHINYRLVDWLINIPFKTNAGYIGDKVLGGDLAPPG